MGMKWVTVLALLGSVALAEEKAATPKQLKQGKKILQTTCIGCHTTPTYFKGYSFKQGGKAQEIYKTLGTGLGTMPSFQTTLSDEERWAAAYAVEAQSKK